MPLVTPIPFPDESPASILMRVASLNCWGNVTTMLYAHNLPMSASLTWRLPEKFKHYMHALGITVPEDIGAFRTRGSHYGKRLKFSKSIELPLDLFRPDGGAICSECLREYPYLRREWTLRLIASCPEHGCLLRHACPRCGAELNWNRPAPELCVCRFDLRRSPTRLGNHDLAKNMHNLLIQGEAEKLNKIADAFAIFRRTCRPELKFVSDEEILLISLQDHEQQVEFLANFAKDVVHFEHPRLVLLPFLKGREREAQLAEYALKRINDVAIPDRPQDPILGKLNCSEAGFALGALKSSIIFDLISLGLIAQLRPRARQETKYSKSSIDQLLRLLWRPSTQETINARKAALTTSVAKIVERVIREPELNAGYDLHSGLFSLREMQSARRQDAATSEQLIDIGAAARMMNVHTEVVRSLLKLGYLEKHKIPNCGRRIYLDKSQVAAFEEKYVFAGALARSIQAAPTKFIEKLYMAGVKPVGGPGIDGLLVYLLHRSDVGSLDLMALKAINGPPTSKCMKRSRDFVEAIPGDPSISAADVASDLGFKVQDVIKLVRKGVLKRADSPHRGVNVLLSSLENLQKQLNNKKLIEVAAAAHQLGEEMPQFLARWVSTGILEVIDLGVRRVIRKNDYEKVAKWKNEYLTAKEAAEIYDKPRSWLPNLERRGLISSIRIGHCGKLRLYSRIHARTAAQEVKDSLTL